MNLMNSSTNVNWRCPARLVRTNRPGHMTCIKGHDEILWTVQQKSTGEVHLN